MVLGPVPSLVSSLRLTLSPSSSLAASPCRCTRVCVCGRVDSAYPQYKSTRTHARQSGAPIHTGTDIALSLDHSAYIVSLLCVRVCSKRRRRKQRPRERSAVPLSPSLSVCLARAVDKTRAGVHRSRIDDTRTRACACFWLRLPSHSRTLASLLSPSRYPGIAIAFTATLPRRPA